MGPYFRLVYLNKAAVEIAAASVITARLAGKKYANGGADWQSAVNALSDPAGTLAIDGFGVSDVIFDNTADDFVGAAIEVNFDGTGTTFPGAGQIRFGIEESLDGTVWPSAAGSANPEEGGVHWFGQIPTRVGLALFRDVFKI